MPEMIYSFNGKDITMNVCIQIRDVLKLLQQHYHISFEKAALKFYKSETCKTLQETENGYQMTEFSNYGSNIDIVAPGYDVYSTITEKDDSYTEENPGHKNLRTVKNGIKYGNLSGTSMAAPLVSGSAAVLWSVAPELSAEEVK